MNQNELAHAAYVCPMHSEVRQFGPGNCTRCGMHLVLEGTRFAMIKHIAKNPWMVIAMIVLMVAVMVAVMMMR